MRAYCGWHLARPTASTATLDTIAMLTTPDGHGHLELVEYIHPDAIGTEPTRPNEIGMHRVAFSVDDALSIALTHRCYPLRDVATYQDVHTLTYIRGPNGIIVMLAEQLRKTTDRASASRTPASVVPFVAALPRPRRSHTLAAMKLRA